MSDLHPIPEGPARRAAITEAIMAETGLDRAAIEALLRAFYGAAREDAVLGPAFAGVADWEAHIARLTAFWCAVALGTGEYEGRPMQAHMPLRLAPPHFARWLALFEATCRARLTPAGADHVMERARRIARSLEMGLVPFDPRRAAA